MERERSMIPGLTILARGSFSRFSARCVEAHPRAARTTRYRTMGLHLMSIMESPQDNYRVDVQKNRL